MLPSSLMFDILKYFTGNSPQESVETCINMMQERVGGTGGAIALNTKGDIGIYFNTKGMSWCSIKHGELAYGIYQGEKHTRQYD